MNPWVELLVEGRLGNDDSKRIRIEDNIGESIHIHFSGSRLELSINDFYTFANEVQKADDNINHGDN